MTINLLSSLYTSKPMQKAVNWAVREIPPVKEGGASRTNLTRLKSHLPPIFGLWIAGFYVWNNMKSKEIPEERKLPLAINVAFSSIVGAIGGYILNGGVTKFNNALGDRFDKAVKDNPDKEILKKGLKSMGPLVAFTLAFRYICPVLATPAANQINKFLIKHNIVKAPPENKKADN